MTESFLTEEAKKDIQDMLSIGDSGVSDYDELENKPSINNVTLSGNKSLSDLGITNIKTVNNTSPDANGNVNVAIDQTYVDSAVSDWLTAHPEATTTVQDGSITAAKLATGVKSTLADSGNKISTLNEWVGLDDSGSTIIDIIDTRADLQNRRGIDYTWNTEKTICTLYGTVSSTDSTGSFNNLIAVDTFPHNITAGDTLRVRVNSSDSDKIFIMIFWRPSSAGLSSVICKTDTDVVIPTGADGCVIRINTVASGSINGTIEPYVFYTSGTKTMVERVGTVENGLSDIGQSVGTFDSSIERLNTWIGAKKYPQVTSIKVGEIINYNNTLNRVFGYAAGVSYYHDASLDNELLWIKNAIATTQNNDLISTYGWHGEATSHGITYTWINGNKIHIEGTRDNSTSFNNLIISKQEQIPGLNPGDEFMIKVVGLPNGFVVRWYYYENGSTTSSGSFTTNKTRIFKYPSTATGIFVRLEASSGTGCPSPGTDVEIKLIPNPSIKHIKVLCIGNSYTNDNTAYTPMIIEGVAHDVAITMGTSYYSGATINDYIGWFDNNSNVLTYYKYNGLSGVWDDGVSNKTIKQILADEDWDIITFQQASSYQGDWSTYSNLNNLIDKITTYYATAHNKGVKVGWLFPQLRLSIISTTTYDKVITCIQNLLASTPVDFVIPCGTAVQNARGTSLNSLGNSGGLTADSNGHLQAGLPSLLGSYVSALKILEICGEQYHGILQEKTRPTAEWIAAKNTPGENGTSTGVTDENCYLAQKCAIAAIKKPFEISTIS